MASNQKIVALSIFLSAGAALAVAFFLHNPAAIQDLSTAEPTRATGEDKDTSSLSSQPQSTSGEAKNMPQSEPSERRGAEEGEVNDASDNSSKNGIDALESDLPMMKVSELLQRLTDGIEGNPVAFNSRYGIQDLSSSEPLVWRLAQMSRAFTRLRFPNSLYAACPNHKGANWRILNQVMLLHFLACLTCMPLEYQSSWIVEF